LAKLVFAEAMKASVGGDAARVSGAAADVDELEILGDGALPALTPPPAPELAVSLADAADVMT
jgi:hypothetical protein